MGKIARLHGQEKQMRGGPGGMIKENGGLLEVQEAGLIYMSEYLLYY